MKDNKGFTKDFWLVVIGQIISLFGNATMRFALPIHLLTETGSAALLGIVSGCAFIPLAIMSPVGGIIADRVNKRNIMVVLDFFTSGLTILFLLLYGRVNLTGLVLVMMFLLYGIAGAYQPSVQASIPVLVAEDKVMPANAIVSMVSSLSSLLGPALGGMAYAAWGIIPVLGIAAGCFFFSAVMEIFIHIPFVKHPKGESMLQDIKTDIKDSIHYITKEKKALGKWTICCSAINLVLSALIVIGLPVVVTQTLNFSSEEASKLYGFLEGCLAIGGLLGGMIAGIFNKKMSLNKTWRFIVVAGLLLLPMSLVLFLEAPAYLSYAVFTLAGMTIMAFASIYTIQIMSYVQITVPEEIVGKVIAWILAIATCAHPIGQFLYGMLLEYLANIMYVIFLIAAVLTMLIGWYSKKISEKLN